MPLPLIQSGLPRRDRWIQACALRRPVILIFINCGPMAALRRLYPFHQIGDEPVQGVHLLVIGFRNGDTYALIQGFYPAPGNPVNPAASDCQEKALRVCALSSQLGATGKSARVFLMISECMIGQLLGTTCPSPMVPAQSRPEPRPPERCRALDTECARSCCRQAFATRGTGLCPSRSHPLDSRWRTH